jgi:hypothetical protein
LAATAPNSSDEAFVRHAFEQLLGFEPGPAELRASLEALRGPFADTSADSGGKAGTPAAEALKAETQTQARAQLVWSLVNHGDFVTLR